MPPPAPWSLNMLNLVCLGQSKPFSPDFTSSVCWYLTLLTCPIAMLKGEGGGGVEIWGGSFKNHI